MNGAADKIKKAAGIWAELQAENCRSFGKGARGAATTESAQCMDCSLPYSAMGVDLVLPNQIWNALCPENGILCANCICLRLDKRGGTSCLQAWANTFNYGAIA